MGTGEGGLRPLASFPEVTTASLLSPSSFQRQSLPYKQEGGPQAKTSSPSFLPFPPPQPSLLHGGAHQSRILVPTGDGFLGGQNRA